MTARERWEQRRQKMSEFPYSTRLPLDIEQQVRKLSATYNMPISQVMVDLISDGLKLYRGERNL